MLWIVGYWHMRSYAGIHGANVVTETVTIVVLSSFFFLSGYFVSRSFKLGHPGAVRAFYLGRFLRIYPLYLAALLVFLVLNIIDPLVLMKSALLVSMLVKPAAPTLWFISLLLLLYALTPVMVLALDRYGLRRFAAGLVGAYVLLFLYAHFTHLLQTDTLLYLPVFAQGLVFARREPRHKVMSSVWTWTAVLLVGIALLFVPAGPTSWAVLSLPVAAGASGLLYLVFDRLTIRHSRGARSIWFLAYSSYCMYLFHIPVYATLKYIWLPSETGLRILYLCLVGVPAIALVAFGLQLSYDLLLRRLGMNPRNAVDDPAGRVSGS